LARTFHVNSEKWNERAGVEIIGADDAGELYLEIELGLQSGCGAQARDVLL